MNFTVGNRLLYTKLDKDYVITAIDDSGIHLENDDETLIQTPLMLENGIKSGEILKWDMPVVTLEDDIKGSKTLNKTPNFDDYPGSDSRDPLVTPAPVPISTEPSETSIALLLVALVFISAL